MSKRVLIAEDEENIVASIEFLMRGCGFETRVARDGPAAIDCVRDFAPDLVVLDVMLPGRSGYEVCEFIRGQCPGARVLMLTARGGSRDEARGLAAGADAWMTKPFATRELVSRARALLGEPA